MEPNQRIELICTGGTISMTGHTARGALPTVNGTTLAERSGHANRLSVHQIANVGGPALTEHHLAALLTKIEERQASAKGIVVTIGTDAIEEVAFFLSLVLVPDVPVILTGAMRPHDHRRPDGPANISRCVDAIGHGLEAGVYVGFGGKLYAGSGVVKAHTSRLDAFSTERTYRRPNVHIPFTGFSLPVIIVKPALFDDLSYLDAAHGVKALVVEAGGEGNVPAASEQRILEAVRRMPVLMTSRVAHGALGSNYGYAGGSRRLVDSGVIASRWSSPKLRMMASLAVCTFGDAARDFLTTALAEGRS